MRDPELLITLLSRMSADPGGKIEVERYFGRTGRQEIDLHHILLLVDCGYAKWTSTRQEEVRITNDGYDFLNAVGQNASLKDKFLDYFNRGMPLVDAAMKVISLAKTIS